MTGVEWAIVLLLPPAGFGIMLLIDQHRERARQRSWDRDVHQAMRQAAERHPSAPRHNDCGRPDCGVCDLHRRRHRNA